MRPPGVTMSAPHGPPAPDRVDLWLALHLFVGMVVTWGTVAMCA